MVGELLISPGHTFWPAACQSSIRADLGEPKYLSGGGDLAAMGEFGEWLNIEQVGSACGTKWLPKKLLAANKKGTDKGQ